MELLLVRHALPVRVDNRDTGDEADPVLSDRDQANPLRSEIPDGLRPVHPRGS